MFHKHVSLFTPSDIFIWVSEEVKLKLSPDFINALHPNVYIMDIKDASWKVPTNTKPFSHWTMSYRFDLNYFLMGRWRLQFAPEFVRRLGYRYHLQLDDDTFVESPIHYNIVSKLDSNSYKFASWNRFDYETREAIMMLPEFTKEWMISNSYSDPKGGLFNHFTPSNYDGMTSHGWDRQYVRGNFVIWSVEIWQSPLLQNFLSAVIASNNDIERRWQEQGVHNMMRLLFVEESKHFLFKGIYLFLIALFF
jgi:hypothetical protein